RYEREHDRDERTESDASDGGTDRQFDAVAQPGSELCGLQYACPRDRARRFAQAILERLPHGGDERVDQEQTEYGERPGNTEVGKPAPSPAYGGRWRPVARPRRFVEYGRHTVTASSGTSTPVPVTGPIEIGCPTSGRSCAALMSTRTSSPSSRVTDRR